MQKMKRKGKKKKIVLQVLKMRKMMTMKKKTGKR